MRRVPHSLKLPARLPIGRFAALCALLCVSLRASQAPPASQPSKRLGQYRLQSWQSDSGLPQNTVHAVLQTRDGFLWLATEGGLVRFDGFDFRVFDTSSTPQLRSNFVEALMEDREGALWIATSDGLARLAQGRFSAFTIADGLPSNAISAVYQQSSGRLIAATGAGLAAAQGERFAPISGTGILSSAESIRLLPEDAHGTLWAAGGWQLVSVEAGAWIASRPITTNVGPAQAISAGPGGIAGGEVWVGGANGVECFRDGYPCVGAHAEPALRAALASLPSQDVTAMLPAGQAGAPGEMWIGTAAGVALYSNGAAKRIGGAGGLAAGRVQSLFQDRSGSLWAAYRSGVAHIVGGNAEAAPQLSAMSGVLSMFEDGQGDMWFGSEAAGVSVLRDQPFTSIATQQGLSADFVRTIFQDHAGAIWIGTDQGGLDSIVDGKISAAPIGEGLANSVVLSLAETGRDLWAGTPDGLTRLRGGRARLFTSDDGLADNFVRSLYADQDGSLWIGTRNGLSHLSGGVFRSYSVRDGLGSDVIGSVLRARGGTLWVGTLGGLSRMAGDRFVNETTSDGLGADAVTGLFEDSEQTLWVGTNGGGLNRLRDGKFSLLDPKKTGLPDTIYGILQDDGGDLWMSSKTGVYRAAIADLSAYADKRSAELRIARYGASDGMRISECSSGGHPSAWRMSDGTLWFATLKGAAWVDPGFADRAARPPQIRIEQVSLDDHAVDLAEASAAPRSAGEIVVPPGRERIAIRYAGISLRAPQIVRYRYMLRGFDKDWVLAGAARTAYYTNVPPGRYDFIVAASNSGGAWSAHPASARFVVRPRFFQTAWFYLLAAAFLLGMGYLFYRVRLGLVEARYNAVLDERSRIAREVHDTLAQGYVGVSVQLEIASRLLEASQTAAREQLDRAKELVRDGLAEARSSIWELRSQGEGSGALPARIAAAAARKERGDAPAITLQVTGTHRPLPRRVEAQILRIAQEAMRNAVAHAGASRVDVTLAYDADHVSLQVQDDGRGFDEDAAAFAAQGHFGLRGMRERAASIGASLRVDGRAVEGAAIVLIVNGQHAAAREKRR